MKILVAVNDSEHGHQALHQAIRLINLQDATFLILSVEEPVAIPPTTSTTSVPGIPNLNMPLDVETGVEAIKLEEQRTRSAIDWAKQLCEQAGIQYLTRLELGDPKHVICDVAQQENSDLIVVGSHSYNRVERVLMGSVSDYVVHHAPCPVLVVR